MSENYTEGQNNYNSSWFSLMCSSAQKKNILKAAWPKGLCWLFQCSESVCLKGTGFSHNTEARIIITNEKTVIQDGSQASENGAGAKTNHLRDTLDVGAAVMARRAPGWIHSLWLQGACLSLTHTHPLGPAAEDSSLQFSSSIAWGQWHLPPQHLVATHGVAGGHLCLLDTDDAVLERSWRRGAVICRDRLVTDISAHIPALLHLLTPWISTHSMWGAFTANSLLQMRNKVPELRTGSHLLNLGCFLTE